MLPASDAGRGHDRGGREREREGVGEPALEPVGEPRGRAMRERSFLAAFPRDFRAFAIWRRIYPSEASPQTRLRLGCAGQRLLARPPGGRAGYNQRLLYMANLGYVGLGVMGGRMADRLLAKGHTVTGTQPHQVQGAVAARQGDEVGRHAARAWPQAADIVFVMVTDSTALESIASGPDGLVAGLGPGKIVIDMSTVSPATSRRARREGAREGRRHGGLARVGQRDHARAGQADDDGRRAAPRRSRRCSRCSSTSARRPRTSATTAWRCR